MSRNAFAWVVRHLRWLAAVPGLPHLFDALLLTWTALRHPRRRVAMTSLEEAILRRWPCELGTHRFGGCAYLFEGREFAHLHGNGLLDVHLDRTQADAFIAAGGAEPHHVFGRSAWVSYWLDGPCDVPGALRLIATAERLASPLREKASEESTRGRPFPTR